MLMMERGNEQREHQVEIDPDLVPQSRPRSCTWPLPCPEDFIGVEEEYRGLQLSSIKVESESVSACRIEWSGSVPTELKHSTVAFAPAPATLSSLPGSTMIDVQLRKVKSSRRNAWGNQSYAELITRAIESAPDGRLTLSQIYDWMVRCVPYFKDKGDSNSSAGWKNSIRHNLSLHSRFVRVQNEGTGKSSWWMLNPGGGKMGKTVRRRGISIDNGTKWWKSKGRGGGKRVCGGAGLHKSPEHSSPKTQGAIGGDGKGFDAWGDLHSHTSSSDSAFGGHLSPIPAEKQDSEDKVQSHPTSPGLHPTSPSAHPPALDLPQLSDLTGAISQEEGYPQPLQTLQPPHQKVSNFSFSPASERLGSYSGSVYSQPGDTIRQPHIPLHTIQENPDHIHGTVQLYSGSETSTLQSLLTSGLQDPAKDLRLGQDGPRHSLIARSSIGVRSHTDHPRHNLNHHLNHNHSHSLNLGRSHIPSDSHSPSHHLDHNPNRSHNLSLDHSSSCDHSHRQEQALSPRLSAELFPTYSLKAHAFYSSSSKLHNLLPASTTQPSNPSSMVSCHLATAPQPWHQPYTIHHQEQEHYFHTQSTGYYSYHAYHYPSHSHKEFPADSNSEFNLGNMDRGAESMFFNDVMSEDETGFSFHSSWPQGRGLGLGGFPAPPHAHTAQSWVPG